MGGFSSKPTAPPRKAPAGTVTDIDRAILDLKNSRDRLQRYRKKLEADDIKLVEQAKQAKANGKTKMALNLLRLRKHKQQQADSCEEQLLNVLTMVETIDSKQNEKVLLDALATGKDALRKMHEEVTVDQVIELMDQIQEEHEVEREISSILQQTPLSAADELAVEEELEAMMLEMQGEATPSMPVAPTTKLPEQKEQQQQVEQTSRVQEQRVAVPG